MASPTRPASSRALAGPLGLFTARGSQLFDFPTPICYPTAARRQAVPAIAARPEPVALEHSKE